MNQIPINWSKPKKSSKEENIQEKTNLEELLKQKKMNHQPTK